MEPQFARLEQVKVVDLTVVVGAVDRIAVAPGRRDLTEEEAVDRSGGIVHADLELGEAFEHPLRDDAAVVEDDQANRPAAHRIPVAKITMTAAPTTHRYTTNGKKECVWR